MRILVGYDGTRGSEDAIEDLVRAGLPREAECRVLCAADVVPVRVDPAAAPVAAGPNPCRDRAHFALEEARVIAARGARHLAELFPGWTVRGEPRAESPAWALVRETDAWRPDAVVVGSHGRSRFGRWFFGSVAQKVLHEVRATVRIGRLRTNHAPHLRLIVGVDGSPGAEAAVDAVSRRCWPPGTMARAICALDPPTSTAMRGLDDTDATGWAWIRSMTEQAAARLRAAGLDASARVDEGDPKEFLADQAESWDADCVFLGASGHTRGSRALLGSVGAAVAMRAPCSVEIVRAPAQD